MHFRDSRLIFVFKEQNIFGDFPSRVPSVCYGLILWLALLTLPRTSTGTHISGADITYRWISGNTFELSLALYRDCSGIGAPANVSVSYSSASCRYNLSVTLSRVQGTGQEITQPCSTAVTTCSGGNNPGIQKWEYRGNVTLPARCTDWRFGYSICCRNCSITTLAFAGGTCSGAPALYVEATLNNLAAPTNSSPVFSNIPVSFLCIGQRAHYNHGAYNTDGDSITYSFIRPRSDANTSVTFAPGYTTTSPMSSSPAISIDPSGDIIVTPTQTEVGVLAIIVREFRNGVLVGSVIRDMQIWTVPCSNLLPSASGINGTNNLQIIACPGRPVSFNVNSADGNASQALTMSWNNAIPGATFTTTTAQRPVGTFSWTPTAAHARSQPYTFTITVQDNNCPSAGFQTYSYEVFVPPLSAYATSTNSQCTSPPTGTAAAFPTGTGPYQYVWSPGGGTTASITNIGPGTYTATITDAYGCAVNTTATVTAPAPVVIAVAAQANVSCLNRNDGAVAINASGGSTPYTYHWSPSGGTLSSVSGLMAGTYTVTVMDANSCVQSQSVTITQPDELSAVTNGPVMLRCFGDANGSVAVSPAGGTAPYRYEWSYNGATTATVNGLGAGSYSVTVSDANGCATTASITVSQPAPLYTSMATSPSTCGSANGSATVGVSGGASPYLFSWSPGGKDSMTISNVPAGAYTVVVTDALGCTASNVAGVSNLGAPAVALASLNNISCYGQANGTAAINVSGGQPPFNYQWSPSGGTSTFATGLQAGNYTFTVTDSNNCQSAVVVEITQPAPLLSSVQLGSVDCHGGSTGNATVFVSGGSLPYTYQWNNGAGTSATASQLSAGNYQVTVSDVNGCITTQSIAISEPPPITAAIISNSPVSCFGGSNASATAMASGGTAPYDYNWSPTGGALATATGLPAGNYTVTVRDANNCLITLPVSVSQPSAPLAALGSATNVTCHAGMNGSASVNVSGGTYPYQYAWSPNTASTPAVSGLSAGTYAVSVTDARGCQTAATVVIQEPSLLQTTVLAPVDVSCFGGSDASATILATGGAMPYTYSWSGGGATSASANGLSAGTYTVIVSDANACSSSAIVVINEPAPLVAAAVAVNSPLCYGDLTGAASVEVNGGTGPYAYQWSPSGGNDTLATFLGAGNYVVSIRDANGCTTSAAVPIQSPPPLTAISSTVDATCGDPNGSASIIPGGGTAPYSFFWNPMNSTGSTIDSVPAGSYHVIITDANGCSLSQAVAVSNAGGPSLVVSNVEPVHCAGTATGSATIQIAGGTAPLQYQWSPIGGTGLNATALPAGTYSFIARDGSNCISGITVTITEPPLLQTSISGINPLCSGTATGAVAVLATGGVSPYTYVWNQGVHTTASATGLFAGNYNVTVTDAHGCSSLISTTIQEPPPLTAGILDLTQVSCHGANDGAAALNITGGTTPYSFNWVPISNTTPAAAGLSPGNYQVVVTDAKSCTSIVAFTISEPPPLLLSTQGSAWLCTGQTATIAAIANGGTPGYSYHWDNGVQSSSQIVQPVTTTTYAVSLTDANGCTAGPQSVVLQLYPVLNATVSNVDTLCPGDVATLEAFASGSNGGPYNFQWNNGMSGPSIAVNPTATTVYTVTVSDQCGSTPVQLEVPVLVLDNPTSNFLPNTAQGCSPLTVNYANQINLPSGTSYLWDFGDGTTSEDRNPVHTFTQAGTYTVRHSVVTPMGCASQTDVSAAVEVYPTPKADFSAKPDEVSIFHPVVEMKNNSLRSERWSWDFGDGMGNATEREPFYTYRDTGSFMIRLISQTYQGCADTTYRPIRVKGEFAVYIPNTFTPNKDGVNDFFKPLCIGVKDFEMWIYDRWGLTIFATSNPEEGWDGTVQGGNRICRQDVYVYLIRLKDGEGNTRQYTGNINLVH